MTINFTFVVLVVALLTLVVLLREAIRNKKTNILYEKFSILIIMFIVHISGLILQVLFSGTKIPPVYFEYIAYIGGMNFSTATFIIACTYINSNKNTKKLNLLYIIPFVLLIILWTNDLHHIFYKEYSIYLSKTIFGPALDFFTIYSYSLIGISFVMLLYGSVKKSGFISKQTALIVLGLLFPTFTNFIGVLGVNLNLTVYATPILFTATSVCLYIAIFRMKALNVIPIAIKTIINTMTDSFIVISNDGTIADINKTCIDKFKPVLVAAQNDNLYDKLYETQIIDVEYLRVLIKEAADKKNVITKEWHVVKNTYDKYFEVDIQPIKAKSGNEYVATLILLRDITNAKKDMEVMLKNESLVMLGELAGGVAHDINTPISAIKSGLLIFKELAKNDDEKMLVERMDSCANKIVTLINSLRNQIRNIGSNDVAEVNITAVVKDMAVIIHNELTKNKVNLNLDIKKDIIVKGNSAKLSQVITNIVVNAVQAYEKKGGEVNVSVYEKNKHAVISIEDFAGGIPEYIRENIGKNILTTKGVSGTGFGLYLAYSVIKGSFGGEITFDTEEGKGTTFYIEIPIN